jgi:hypothetical protein
MNKCVFVLSFLMATTVGFYSWSEVRLGVEGSLGMAAAVGNFDDDRPEVTPRFAGGVALLADILFTEMIGISTGVGLLGEGWRVYTKVDGVEIDTSEKILFLQFPVCFLLELSDFQIGAGVAFDIGLNGKIKGKEGDDEIDIDLDDISGGNQWRLHRRFNIAAKAFLGYAVALGPIFIVPRLSFLFHLLNEHKDEDEEGLFESTTTIRFMNIMLGIAVLYKL